MRTCKTCHHFQAYHLGTIDSYRGSRDFTQEELKGKHCHRLGKKVDPFLTIASSTCALHETPFERKWFFWVKFLFPWAYLFRMRTLAKKSLEIEGKLRDNGHAFRAALKCAFSGLEDCFKSYRALPQVKGYVSPRENIVLKTLDNLGAVAHEPALSDIIKDLKVKNPETGTFYNE